MRNTFQSNFGAWVHALALTKGRLEDAAAIARRTGAFRNSAVGATTSSDLEQIGHSINDAFFASLEHGGGVFDAIAQRSRRAQFHVRTLIPTAPVEAKKTAEGTAVSVSKFALNAATLVPLRVAGMVVASNESLATPEGAGAVETELREAVTLATDTEFLSLLASGAGFTGGMTGVLTADIGTLLEKVNTTGYGNLVLAVNPEIANFMATRPADFPDMSPTGGTACGIETVVSAGCPGMMLIDSSAIMTGSDAFELRFSESATIEMDDEPSMDSGTPAGPTGAVVSCFQADCTAVIGERSFGALVVRPSGVAVLVENPETT